jgi:hypothetical protein
MTMYSANTLPVSSKARLYLKQDIDPTRNHLVCERSSDLEASLRIVHSSPRAESLGVITIPCGIITGPYYIPAVG